MRSAVPWPKPLSFGHGPADPGFRLALPMDLLHSRVTRISDRAYFLRCSAALTAVVGPLVAVNRG